MKKKILYASLATLVILFLFIAYFIYNFPNYFNHKQGPLSQLISSGKYPKLDTSKDVKGIVTNKYEIRDDILNWILDKKLDERKTKALIQTARTLQMALLSDKNNRIELNAVTNHMSRSVQCVYLKFDEKTADQMTSSIEMYTVNTKIRFNEYAKYNAAQDGTTSRSPEGNSCD